MVNDQATPEQAARGQAVNRLKKQRDFRGHLLAYLLVNTVLVVIWATTSAGFFWPAFVITPWGIAVAMTAWEVYGPQDPSEES
jgi:hypothetical protein